jgi:hydroxypyruvate reductase
MNPKKLMTKSLRASPKRESVTNIMMAALEAVDPFKAVHRFMKREGSQLHINGRIYNLRKIERVLLIGFGKASIPMGEAAADILGDDLYNGIIVTKGKAESGLFSNFIIEGGHPVPDKRSIRSAQKVVDLLSTTTENDLVICLISGGGSALLTLPVPGISLDNIQYLTKMLLGCGASINEINCLRKHLSQIKGGQLARLAAPAQSATLILSDVVGDPLDVIASGPMVPDPSTFLDALDILEKYQILTDTPIAISEYLQRGASGDIPDTPKPKDSSFEKVQTTIIGNNYLASKAAIKQAKLEGFNTILLTTHLQGEARIVGKMLAAIAKQIAISGEPIARPACLIAGGETTVTIQGDGLGGRNQELALGAVEDLKGIKNVILIAFATDGDDGPTDAAGAVITGNTWKHANQCGLNTVDYLAQNDSYHFFNQLGDLIKPGMTATNVNDLAILTLF